MTADPRGCLQCGREFVPKGRQAYCDTRCRNRCGNGKPARAAEPRIRYGAWFTGTDWKHHQRSGVTAFATVAELLEACK